MRNINNTIRWARKTNAATTTYHMVADQTDTGRGYRAACNRSYLLEMHADATDGQFAGFTADQVDRSTYGMFCDRCRTRAEAVTAGDQAARDRDHVDALVENATRVETPADADDIYPAHDHDATFRHPIVNAGGVETGRCGVCNARITRTVTATGWTAWTVRTETPAPTAPARTYAENDADAPRCGMPLGFGVCARPATHDGAHMDAVEMAGPDASIPSWDDAVDGDTVPAGWGYPTDGPGSGAHVNPAPNVGETVQMDDDTAAWWANHGVPVGTVFTVENVTYGLGGQMSAETRADIADGWAHIVMADANGRRVGTTARHIRPADNPATHDGHPPVWPHYIDAR